MVEAQLTREQGLVFYRGSAEIAPLIEGGGVLNASGRINAIAAKNTPEILLPAPNLKFRRLRGADGAAVSKAA